MLAPRDVMHLTWERHRNGSEFFRESKRHLDRDQVIFKCPKLLISWANQYRSEAHESRGSGELQGLEKGEVSFEGGEICRE